MLSCVYFISFSLLFSSVAQSGITSQTPRDVPPVVGTAVATGDDENVRIKLTCPRVVWRVARPVVPKSDRPELQVDVKNDTRTLVLGDAGASADSRVVDLAGVELTNDDIRQRLKTDTPVLVSVSGKMVEPLYLQLTKPDALIILLGDRDGVPASTLLPSAAPRPAPTPVSPLVFDDHPRWRSVLLRRDHHRPRGRLRGVLGIGER
jgi:hypothetical protein